MRTHPHITSPNDARVCMRDAARRDTMGHHCPWVLVWRGVARCSARCGAVRHGGECMNACHITVHVQHDALFTTRGASRRDNAMQCHGIESLV